MSFSYKADPYYSLYMYLRLGKPSHNQEGSVFLKRFYSSCLIIVKRQFDMFIKNQVNFLTVQSKKIHLKASLIW